MEPVRRDHPVRARLVDRAVELVVPIGVHIDVTYRCDLDCVHCYLTDRKRDELTLHEYRRLFDDLRELGTLYLLVSGGEIFHRPDGLEILREARNRRFDVRIITHGGHIDDEVADALAEMKVTSVAMSIYASEPGIHDSVTRVPGSFERTIAAARALRQRGILVGFKFSVMRDNLHQIQATRALAAEVGAGIEISAHIRGDNEGSDALRDLRVDFDEQLAVADCVYSAIAGADTLPLFAPDDHTCLAGHASFYIGPDGTVTPCIDWEEAAGNIRDTPTGHHLAGVPPLRACAAHTPVELRRLFRLREHLRVQALPGSFATGDGRPHGVGAFEVRGDHGQDHQSRSEASS